MNPLVSVIITTRNEEKNIENCLKSVLAQTYPQEKYLQRIRVKRKSSCRGILGNCDGWEKIDNFSIAMYYINMFSV